VRLNEGILDESNFRGEDAGVVGVEVGLGAGRYGSGGGDIVWSFWFILIFGGAL